MTKFLHKINKHENYSNNVNKDHKFNITLCEDEYHLHYDKYVPETRLVTKYNVTSTSDPTALRTNYEQNIFKSMEIDGVMLDELVTVYTFDTTGVHTVKYELYDETKLGNQAPVFNNIDLVECIIPDNVTIIGSNVFNGCNGLTSVTIPNSVTSIGISAFINCSSLTSINMPNGVTSIGMGAFVSCSSLTNVTIPNSVASIGNEAFYQCGGLTSVTVYATTPPTLGGNAFINTNNCPIYVPSNNIDTYKSASGWSNYADRIQAIS